MLNEAPAYDRENGRKAPRPNARRLPPIGLRLVVGLLEAAQQLVAALDCRIERLLSRLGARPHGLQFRSEEHTSELQSLMRISYAVFCLKKKTYNKSSPEHYSTIHQ